MVQMKTVKMTTQIKKTKKIKIITTILSIVVIISSLIIITSLNTTSYCMQINAPNRIIVYYNNETNNKGFERGNETYNIIYSSITKAYEQSVLSAIITGKIFKDVKIVKIDNTDINFSGIKINFIYDNPQVVKYKKKLYTHNDETYWYQSLIFDITDSNKYQLNKVAIIPPPSSNNYISTYNYSLSYLAYSNFNKTYNQAITLF